MTNDIEEIIENYHKKNIIDVISVYNFRVSFFKFVPIRFIYIPILPIKVRLILDFYRNYNRYFRKVCDLIHSRSFCNKVLKRLEERIIINRISRDKLIEIEKEFYNLEKNVIEKVFLDKVVNLFLRKKATLIRNFEKKYKIPLNIVLILDYVFYNENLEELLRNSRHVIRLNKIREFLLLVLLSKSVLRKISLNDLFSYLDDIESGFTINVKATSYFNDNIFIFFNIRSFLNSMRRLYRKRIINRGLIREFLLFNTNINNLENMVYFLNNPDKIIEEFYNFIHKIPNSINEFKKLMKLLIEFKDRNILNDLYIMFNKTAIHELTHIFSRIELKDIIERNDESDTLIEKIVKRELKIRNINQLFVCLILENINTIPKGKFSIFLPILLRNVVKFTFEEGLCNLYPILTLEEFEKIKRSSRYICNYLVYDEKYNSESIKYYIEKVEETVGNFISYEYNYRDYKVTLKFRDLLFVSKNIVSLFHRDRLVTNTLAYVISPIILYKIFDNIKLKENISLDKLTQNKDQIIKLYTKAFTIFLPEFFEYLIKHKEDKIGCKEILRIIEKVTKNINL